MIEIRAKGHEHIQVEDRGKGAGLLIGYGEARVFLPSVELDHFIARLTNINAVWEREYRSDRITDDPGVK